MAIYSDSFLLTPLTPSMSMCSSIQEPLESLPVTPPDSAEPFGKNPRRADNRTIKRALHVLANERDALAHLENLYTSSGSAQFNLWTTINQILQCQAASGKIVFTGIGKSRLIALKLVATFVSLGIHSVFLHPSDALHGDLGVIRPDDVVLMITFSGKTPELLTLLPHIPSYIPLIVITSHLSPDSCPLLTDPRRRSSTNILLSAPIHESETSTFGLPAPTTSTTVALALGDSLALSVAEKMHSSAGQSSAEVFASNHPGGAIGASLITDSRPSTSVKMADIAMSVAEIPIIESTGLKPLSCLDIILAAVRAPRGWLKTSPTHIIAPRRSSRLRNPQIPLDGLTDEHGAVVIEKDNWISILGDCTVQECREWIFKMRNEGNGRGKEFLRPGTLLGIVDRANQVSGIVEIEDVVGDDFAQT